MPVFIIIETKDESRKEKLTSQPLLIGRSSSCSIKLSDGQISGKHLQIYIGKDGKTIVKDLETTNGTFLNGSKIMESHLFLDDELKIGDVIMYLDPSEMGPKEKAIHTRAGEKTQHTFVNLPVDEALAIKRAMQKAKDKQKEAVKAEPPPKASFQNEDARQKEIMALLNEEKSEPPPQPKEDGDSPGMRTRVINKAKEKVKKKENPAIHEVRDGENFELEESSGDTQFLKIEKPSKKKK